MRHGRWGWLTMLGRMMPYGFAVRQREDGRYEIEVHDRNYNTFCRHLLEKRPTDKQLEAMVGRPGLRHEESGTITGAMYDDGDRPDDEPGRRAYFKRLSVLMSLHCMVDGEYNLGDHAPRETVPRVDTPHVERFLEARYRRTDKCARPVFASELYLEYVAWCKESLGGCSGLKPLGRRAFDAQVKAAGVKDAIHPHNEDETVLTPQRAAWGLERKEI